MPFYCQKIKKMEKIIQITAGRGPAECSWVVAQVLKLFLEEVRKEGLEYNLINSIPGTENGTLQSVVLSLKGSNLNTFLETWLGTVQWIGISEFRTTHKRKNWFIGVYEVPQEQMLELNENEITFQAMRSSGPGGQNVNKVNSAVRATHKESGLSVVAMESRSQHQNKKLAIDRLRVKVYEANLEKVKNNINNQWEHHLNLKRGNPVRVFRGSDFKKKKKVETFKNKRAALKQDLRNRLEE